MMKRQKNIAKFLGLNFLMLCLISTQAAAQARCSLAGKGGTDGLYLEFRKTLLWDQAVDEKTTDLIVVKGDVQKANYTNDSLFTRNVGENVKLSERARPSSRCEVDLAGIDKGREHRGLSIAPGERLNFDSNRWCQVSHGKVAFDGYFSGNICEKQMNGKDDCKSRMVRITCMQSESKNSEGSISNGIEALRLHFDSDGDKGFANVHFMPNATAAVDVNHLNVKGTQSQNPVIRNTSSSENGNSLEAGSAVVPATP